MRDDSTYSRTWRWQWHAALRPGPQGPALNAPLCQLEVLSVQFPRGAIGSAPGVLPTVGLQGPISETASSPAGPPGLEGWDCHKHLFSASCQPRALHQGHP